jgi:hypothetical protein
MQQNTRKDLKIRTQMTCPTVLQNHDDINKQSSLLIYKNIISTRHKELEGVGKRGVALQSLQHGVHPGGSSNPYNVTATMKWTHEKFV